MMCQELLVACEFDYRCSTDVSEWVDSGHVVLWLVWALSCLRAVLPDDRASMGVGHPPGHVPPGHSDIFPLPILLHEDRALDIGLIFGIVAECGKHQVLLCTSAQAWR